MSPVLFSVYIDQLLFNLQIYKYGCYVAYIFMDAFAYDIVILAPTKYALRAMLKIINEFSCQYEIKFNLTMGSMSLQRGRHLMVSF